MLKLNISKVVELRSIKRPFTYLVKLGLSRSVSHKIAAGDVKVLNLGHLTKLCLTLDCTPNDLFEWQGETTGMHNHHSLRDLIHINKKWDNIKKIKDMPLDKLARLSDMIEDME